jgi:hypothetical protein
MPQTPNRTGGPLKSAAPSSWPLQRSTGILPAWRSTAAQRPTGSPFPLPCSPPPQECMVIGPCRSTPRHGPVPSPMHKATDFFLGIHTSSEMRCPAASSPTLLLTTTHQNLCKLHEFPCRIIRTSHRHKQLRGLSSGLFNGRDNRISRIIRTGFLASAVHSLRPCGFAFHISWATWWPPWVAAVPPHALHGRQSSEGAGRRRLSARFPSYGHESAVSPYFSARRHAAPRLCSMKQHPGHVGNSPFRQARRNRRILSPFHSAFNGSSRTLPTFMMKHGYTFP